MRVVPPYPTAVPADEHLPVGPSALRVPALSATPGANAETGGCSCSMLPLETEALRGTCSPASLPLFEGRNADKGQLAEAATR